LSGTPTPDFLKSSDEFDKTLDDFITSSNNNFHYSDNTSSCSPISPINHCFSETNHVDHEPEPEPKPETAVEEIQETLENRTEDEPAAEVENTEETAVDENVESEMINDDQIDQEIVEVEKSNDHEPVELTNGHDQVPNEHVAEEEEIAEAKEDSPLVKEKPVVPEKPAHLLKQASNGDTQTDESPKTNGHAKPEIKQKPEFLKNYKPSIFDSMSRTFKMSNSHFSSSTETAGDSCNLRTDFQSSKKFSQSLQENGHTAFHHGFSDKMNECIEATSNMFRDVLATHQNGHDIEDDDTATSGGSVPWPITNRRTKFRVNQMSRDVPFGSPRNFTESEHLNNTKGCLLHILERFNDPSITHDQSKFSRNIEKNLTSMNWDTDRSRMQEDMTVETMNSINAFFHQRTNGGKTVKQMREQLETKSKF
jgi:hypothetical protein